MESVLLKANLINLSTGQYWLNFDGQKGMSDREGHGHKAVLYNSQFPPLRHSFRQRHRCIHRLINHVYTKDQALCYSLPDDSTEVSMAIKPFWSMYLQTYLQALVEVWADDRTHDRLSIPNLQYIIYVSFLLNFLLVLRFHWARFWYFSLYRVVTAKW